MNLLSPGTSSDRPIGGLCHTLRLAATTALVVTATTFPGSVRQAHADPTLMMRNVTSGSFQILEFDASTGAPLGPVLAGYNGGFFSSFARGPDKNLYIGRQFDGTIDRYNGVTGTFMNVFAATTGVTNLAFGPDGNLYVGRGTNGIFKYDAATGSNLGLFVAPPSAGASVSGMTFRGGSLYVSYEGGSFYRYDAATGGSPQQIASGLSSNGPRAAGFDGLGSIYLPIWQTTSILRFNEATLAVTGTINTASGVSPNSLAFDESGTLLVLSDNGSQSRINRYNPTTGAFIDTLVSPGTGGLGRAFDMVLIVPEPATFCMILAGLAYGAMQASRRRIAKSSRCEPPG